LEKAAGSYLIIELGLDYRWWKAAEWMPCSSYLSEVCSITDPPPATWAIGGILPGDPRLGNYAPGQFLRQYGVGFIQMRYMHSINFAQFDSQTPGSECWATYDAQTAHVTVTDHGFRAFIDDP
jgi:chitinase